MEEYIVATVLRTSLPIVRQTIEDIVQRRSRIESFGNAVFTLLLLRRFESTKPITASFVSQFTIGACMRAVCVRKTQERPLPVEFKIIEVQECLRAAQDTVTSMMESFDSDEGLGQTMNAASRRYLTVLKNNFSERLESWQARTILAELRQREHIAIKDPKLSRFLVRAMIRLIGQQPWTKKNTNMPLFESTGL